jgi:hypothetical protein
MTRFYVKIVRSNGEWTCTTVRARNEQLAVWAAFEQLNLKSADGWRATEVTLQGSIWD